MIPNVTLILKSSPKSTRAVPRRYRSIVLAQPVGRILQKSSRIVDNDMKWVGWVGDFSLFRAAGQLRVSKGEVQSVWGGTTHSSDSSETR